MTDRIVNQDVPIPNARLSAALDCIESGDMVGAREQLLALGSELPKDVLLGCGATGEFPDGSLGDGDEGELQFAVLGQGGLVHLVFGVEVRTVSLPPDQALRLGAMIHACAASALCGP